MSSTPLKPCRNGHVTGRNKHGECRGCMRDSERRRLRRRNDERATRPYPADGLCELCGGPPTGRYPRLHLDHDHVTGAFRGWLCACCNTSIGKLGDNAASLQRAVDYLTRAEATSPSDPYTIGTGSSTLPVQDSFSVTSPCRGTESL